MTCMKLNRKPSHPHPPPPRTCMMTLNHDNDEEKRESSIFFQSAFFPLIHLVGAKL